MTPLPLKFDAEGLVPVIVQDHLTGEIRMQAFATEEAIRRTMESGKATFWSRSRREIWEKGETSGNAIDVLEVFVDCDADSVVYLSDPSGNSCHTGARSCYFQVLAGRAATALSSPAPAESSAQPLIGRLEDRLESRKKSSETASYTKTLYESGAAGIGAKVVEEGAELAHALAAESDDRVVSEAADVVYHLLVGLRWRGLPWRRVLAELARRTATSGHAEKASRAPTR
jgi:phosphoribosyl-ATP pyrophosphohydrolase/phosphoribosyl-AMP cyclohydrolase